MAESKKRPTSQRLNKLMFSISLLMRGLAIFSGVIALILELDNLAYYQFFNCSNLYIHSLSFKKRKTSYI